VISRLGETGTMFSLTRRDSTKFVRTSTQNNLWSGQGAPSRETPSGAFGRSRRNPAGVSRVNVYLFIYLFISCTPAAIKRSLSTLGSCLNAQWVVLQSFKEFLEEWSRRKYYEFNQARASNRELMDQLERKVLEMVANERSEEAKRYVRRMQDSFDRSRKTKEWTQLGWFIHGCFTSLRSDGRVRGCDGITRGH
jgi:hypothetical protein